MVIDTGASNCFISREEVDEIKLNSYECKKNKLITAQNATTIQECVDLEFFLKDIRFTQTFYVIENLSHSVLIGKDFLSRVHSKTDISERKIEMDGKIYSLVPINTAICSTSDEIIAKNEVK